MTDEPLVSTIIPTHNRASLLKSAIESVLSQDVKDHEIIVVDDNSADNTPEIVARYPVRYLRVQCGKPSQTRNAGIRAARGRYVAFLDDDDIWLPDRLRASLEMMEADPAIGMVYGQVQPADADLHPFGPAYPPLPLAEGHPVSAFLDVVICMNAATIRRAALDDVGLFDETVYGAEDMDLTVRIARRYRCAAISHPLSVVRFHSSFSNGSDRLWSRHQDQSKLMRHHLSIKDTYQPNFLARQRILSKHNGWYTHLFLEQTKREGADLPDVRSAIKYAFKASPLHALKSPAFWDGVRRCK